MTLADFLRQEGKTAAAFAREAGLGSRQLVHKYIRHERMPRPRQMQAIVKATGGKVTAADFYAAHQAAA